MISDETNIGDARADADGGVDADTRTEVTADGVRQTGGVPEAVVGDTRDPESDGKKTIKMTNQRRSNKFSVP